MRTMILLFAGCLGLGLAPRMNAQTSRPALKKVAEFDLPGPGGKRFDYLAIDPDDHYLFSAHLAAGQTYVVDLRTNKVVATVADTPGVEGIEYVPELKKFYTSNAGDNTIGVVEGGHRSYNYRPDSDLYVINIGTQFASIALATPPQVGETASPLRKLTPGGLERG